MNDIFAPESAHWEWLEGTQFFCHVLCFTEVGHAYAAEPNFCSM